MKHPIVSELDHHLSLLKVERIVAEGLISLVVVLALSAVGYLGYTKNYTGARVALGDENISFKSRGEVAGLVRERTSNLTVRFILPNKIIERKASEIGITPDVEDTVEQIFSDDNYTLAGAKSAAVDTYRGRSLSYLFEIDEERFEEFSDFLSAEAKTLPINASVVFKESAYEVVPGVPGRELARGRLVSSVTSSLAQLKKVVEVPLNESPAPIGLTAASEAARRGEEIAANALVMKVDSASYHPSKAEIAEWIDFKPENDKYTVYIDRVLVGAYLIERIGAAHDDAYREVNTDQATGQIAQSLEAGQDLEFVVPFVSKLSRPPAAWDRYAEINLSKQHFYAISNGRVELESPTATGRRISPTPAGVFNINRRLRFRTMTGGDPPNTYPLPNVPHVQYFTNRGHAIHGAYWHNQFGYFSWRGAYGRSHGCVNLPLSFAAKFWDWNVGLGLPVWIHY